MFAEMIDFHDEKWKTKMVSSTNANLPKRYFTSIIFLTNR